MTDHSKPLRLLIDGVLDLHRRSTLNVQGPVLKLDDVLLYPTCTGR